MGILRQDNEISKMISAYAFSYAERVNPFLKLFQSHCQRWVCKYIAGK